jgi:hypothetical protein
MVLIISILPYFVKPNFFVQQTPSEKTISFMQNTGHIVLRAKIKFGCQLLL